MIVRNSAACKHCGVVIGCTAEKEETWVEHDCEDGWFAINGGTHTRGRTGSQQNWEDTSEYTYVIGMSKNYNPEHKVYLGPGDELCVA